MLRQKETHTMMKTWIASGTLLVSLLAVGASLASWKVSSLHAADGAPPPAEPAEAVSAVVARAREHRDSTSAIGTVLALRSVTLRNELAGTVKQVSLQPGQIVAPGTVLVALDVSVEQADLQAQQAQLALARTALQRLERLREHNASTDVEVDRARAERDVTLAQIARTQAIIARKTIRVPFRARVGLADVHPGQYLNEGTPLTTLQSVDDAVHVDFAVPQAVAAGLRPGDRVEVHAAAGTQAYAAKVEAVDARVDVATRNSMVRARVESSGRKGADAALPAPGSSVRVSVGLGAPSRVVAIPASALRKGPSGDHAFVLAADDKNALRAQLRAVRVAGVVGDEVLVEQGIEAGEQVATSGSFKLRDAALVAVSQPVAAAADAAAPKPTASGS
jgi:membrane fusion protein, multidrug efflux system